MMLLQLPNGGTMRMDVSRYLSLSDEELDRILMYKSGTEINDPFHDSVLNDKHMKTDDDDEIYDEDEDIIPLSDFDLPEGFEEVGE